MIDLDAALKNIKEEILNTRKDIKNCIEASETRLLMKIEQLKNTISNLEKENSELKEEVEYLKRGQIKKNIVIFGLNKKREEIRAENLCQDLKELVGVDLEVSDFGDIYPLGKVDNCPIKIEFNSNLKKREVLKNCNRLKGKNISIANDLTQTQREEIKILRKHLFLARQDEKFKDCFIKGNKLFVNGAIYGIEDLEKHETFEPKTNSAPSTPTVESTVKITADLKNCPSTPKIPSTMKHTQIIPAQKAVKEKPRTRSVNKL